MMFQKDRFYMIRESLREKAPRAFRELQREKKLEQFVRAQDEMMMEAYDTELDRLLTKELKKQPEGLEAMKAASRAFRQAWNNVLQTYLEFSDSTLGDD